MARRQPGLHIIGDADGGNVDIFTVIREIRTITREELNDSTESSKELPIFYSFEEIAEFQNAYNRKHGKEAEFTVEDAIERARSVFENLTANGVKCDIIYPKEEGEDTLVATIAKMVKNGKTICLTGKTGGGKTAIGRAAFRLAGLNPDPKAGEVMYFSMPTLPPEDLIGIPVPDRDNDKFFSYRQMHSLHNVKAVFFDEANRAHPKNINGIMQMIVEHRINDMEFPNLMAVIMAINPPEQGNYTGAEDLDEAVAERIDHFIQIDYNPDADILTEEVLEKRPSMSRRDVKEAADAVVTFWKELKEEQRQKINPRRLGKMLLAWLDGEDIATTLCNFGPTAVTVNLTPLRDMLRKVKVLTMDTLLSDHRELRDKMLAPGKAAADLRHRFMQLVGVMLQENMYKEMASVAHLFDCVHKDQVPQPNKGPKGYYNFVTKSVKRYDPDNYEAFVNRLHDRANSVDQVKEELDKGLAAFLEKKDSSQTV